MIKEQMDAIWRAPGVQNAGHLNLWARNWRGDWQAKKAPGESRHGIKRCYAAPGVTCQNGMRDTRKDTGYEHGIHN